MERKTRKQRLAYIDFLYSTVNAALGDNAEIVSTVALIYAQAQNGRIERRLLDWCEGAFRDKRFELWKRGDYALLMCAFLDVADKWNDFAV